MNGKRKMDAGRETSEVTYIVLNMDSDHSESTASERLLTNSAVDAVVVDHTTKGLTVHGQGLDVVGLASLDRERGYQAA